MFGLTTHNMVRSLIFLINLFWLCCCAPVDYYVHNTNSNGSVTNFAYDSNSANSPANWKEFSPECGGHSQSPINIQTRDSVKISNKLGEIKGTKWAEKPTMITVDNNGFTVRFVFTYADQANLNILLNEDVYELAQLHYHFGTNSKSGTEHHINNRAYAMEGHAVFYKRNYQTFTNALTFLDGVVVISRLYEEDNFFNFNNVNIDFGFLRHVRNPNDTYILNRTEAVFSIEDVMGPLNMPYYRYYGSLTTPGCNEVVTWCVGTKLLRISSDNLFHFRQLAGHDGLMAPNIRPLQKLNQRSIYSHRNIVNKIKFK